MGLVLDLSQGTGRFHPNIWNQMLIEAANSRSGWQVHKNICRVIYPDGRCTLELKTDAQIKEHFRRHGYWASNCVKMHLREIINLTRIISLEQPNILRFFLNFDHSLVPQAKASLQFFASRAEAKYNKGFTGTIRKLISIISNLFTENHVHVFSMSTNGRFLLPYYGVNELPWYIGSDADFANLVAPPEQPSTIQARRDARDAREQLRRERAAPFTGQGQSLA